MHEYKRRLDIGKLLDKKSVFLFGPRSVGKSTLIRQQLPDAIVFDLLDRITYADLLRSPEVLRQQRPRPGQVIVIDEIQKLPTLLDEIHRLIETSKWRFLLTGSSARKLKRGAANLLGGRAWQAHLMPLSWNEIDDFDLLRYLNRGGLPYVYQAEDYREEVKEYISLYLQEEIVAEALVRKVENFARFIDFMGLANGTEINFQNLASDSGVPARTIDNYVTILEDTLIGFRLQPYLKTRTRKAVARSKFFFFDVGVTNGLCHRGEILPKSELFGQAFEHFIVGEIRAWLAYSRSADALRYWRSTSQFEVDVIIGDHTAAEVKGSDLVHDKHLKGLRALKEEKIFKRFHVVSCDRRRRETEDGILIWPWQEFLAALWQGEITP